MKLRLDYDKFVYRMEDTLYMLKSIPTPFDVRISPNKEGLHVRKDGDFDYNDPLYFWYDDPKRLRINRLRNENGISHNILWDVKKGQCAGTWHTINNVVDILSFMTRLPETYIYRKDGKRVAMPSIKYLFTNRGIGE